MIYFKDTFAGAAGTLLTAHTSDSGATWPNDDNHVLGASPIELDGNGMVFPTGSDVEGQLPSITLPSGAFEIIYTVYAHTANWSGTAGITLYSNTPYGSTTSNVSFMSTTNSGAYGSDWFQNGFTCSNTPGFNGTLAIGTGQLWYIKIQILPAYGNSTLYMCYSSDGTTWSQQSFDPTWSTAIGSMVTAVGPVFNLGAATAATGIHIGNLIIQDLEIGSPDSQISNAYVASSGESLALFFSRSGSQLYPNYMVSAPTIYKNGASVGDLSTVIPWIEPTAYPMILPLPSGVAIASTDLVTISSSAGWMLLSGNGVAEAQTNFSVTNFVGRSCFGTDELQKTLPIGVNIACPGTCPNDYSQVFKNMASRLSIGGSTRLPTTPGGTQNFQFISMGGQGSQVPNVFEGVGVTGYFAIGYDDEYITNGGSQTPQLKIISDDPGLGVVTQITSCDNPGTGGLGQYYLFQVTSTGINPNTGMPCFNVPLDLQYPSGSGSRWITNLWILGPGEFTFTPGHPLSFDRSNPWALSNAFLSQAPAGIGSFRTNEALIGAGSDGITMVCEPWEGRLASDVSWNGNHVVTQITYVELRPFVTSVSPYIYADQYGSPWTAASSPLEALIDASQTTITLSQAAVECNGNPIFYGIMIAIGGQGGPGTLEYMRCTGSSGTSVTVARGSAWQGVLTPAVAHGTGETVTLGNRYEWTSIPDLPNWFGGTGHQTFEVVCSSPHNLKSGVQIGGLAGSYSLVDTNGVPLSAIYGFNGLVVVTGATTFVTSGWNGTGSSAATITECYTISSPSVNYTNTLPGDVMPYEGACQVVNRFVGCDIHVNIPMLASDSYVYWRAGQVLANLVPNRKVYIELANEPWGNNWHTQVLQQYLSPILGLEGDGYGWYIIRANEIVQMFKTVFAEARRESEMHLFLNGGPIANWFLSDAQSYNVKMDAIGVAPYYSMDSGAPSTVFCNNASLDQMADLLMHQVYYFGVANFYGNTLNPQIAAYNEASGCNCVLYSYENGYSTGCSTNAAGPTGGNGWFNWQASADIRYLPVWRIYEKDFFAWMQTNGYNTVHVYSFSLYYSYQNCWNIYAWINQQLGMGDGSDGKADNRKYLQTPGYSGPTYFTAGYVGLGSGTVSVENGSTTINFSESQMLTVGNWISVAGDPWNLRYYIVSGSESGPYTIAIGLSNPTPYAGPTNTAASWIYGTTVDQDASCVSVRGQAMVEWNREVGRGPNQGGLRRLGRK